MATACSRCGRVGEADYGADGLPYCSSCVFYGMNRQCFRCRMYVPASELQQYRGVWACPYCVQDMRDEERRGGAPEKPHVHALPHPETCERCGRELDERVYIWNNRRLCRNCLDEEQATWGVVGGRPGHAGVRISAIPVARAKRQSLIESAIGNFLALLGIRKKEQEIVVVEGKMPIGHAKPLAEKRMAKEERKPESEGIMTRKPQESKGSKHSAAAGGRKASTDKKQ